jgi:acetolactate synthase-1/2/3 large subunit
MNGATVVCDAFTKLGITHAFGIPGTQNLRLFDALRQSSIRTILTTDETAASFAANGFYRASGTPALLTTIPGPGLANAISGITEAHHDSAAMIVLIEYDSEFSDRDFRLQDFDIEALCRPVSKDFVRVRSAHNLSEAIYKSVICASAGEPGPVILCVDSVVLSRDAEAFTPGEPMPPATEPEKELVERIGNELLSSGKISILAGQGASVEPQGLLDLAKILRAPVITTCSARGAISEDHVPCIAADISLGTVGLVNELLSECSRILVIGCKLGHNGSCGYELKLDESRLIRVDASPGILTSKNYPAKITVQSDGGGFIRALIDTIGSRHPESDSFTDEEIGLWKNRIERARKEVIKFEPSIDGTDGIGVSTIFRTLDEIIGSESIVVTDAGQHQSLARAYLDIKSPRGLIVPSDFQSVGYGIPAAIGARLAEPGKKVFAVIGDGAMQASAMEIRTAVREGLDLGIILFNDGALGSIQLQQWCTFGDDYCVALDNPDFALLAESMTAEYSLLNEKTDSALRAFAEGSGVRIIEVRLNHAPEAGKARRMARLRERAGRSAFVKPLKAIRDWIRGTDREFEK